MSEMATRSRPRVRLVRWGARHPDLIAIAGWLLVAAILGFSRREFTGDGVRHLQPILQSGRPTLGEPRWLLFPAFLFGVLRPFVMAGVTTVEGLTRPMMTATLAAAAVYLLSVRACLAALGHSARQRAFGLMVGAFSGGLFFAATDLMEPIFAAALATVGLAFAARTCARTDLGEGARRRSAWVAVSCIALASLLYQGVILAIGLIPLFVPLGTLRDRRTILASGAILAGVPLVTIGALMVTGNSAVHAFARFAQGEENPFYRSYLKKPGLAPYLVALVGGLPQGVLPLPEFHGFNSIISGLKTTATRRQTFEVLARLAIGAAVVIGVTVSAVRRRHRAVIVALAVLLALPLVRHQQYGYLKYYILLPVILSVAAARLRPRAAIALIVVLAATNGAVLVRRIAADRELYDARSAIYSRAGAADCWVTTGWGPAINFKWPGSVCGVLGRLAGGSGNDVQQVVAQAHADLTHCLRVCFCRSSSVYTDDMTERGEPVLLDDAQHFQYSDVDLTALTVPASRAKLMSQPGAAGGPVYTYPADEQRRACEVLMQHDQAGPSNE